MVNLEQPQGRMLADRGEALYHSCCWSCFREPFFFFLVLQNLSTSAFLSGESNPVLLVCMILGFCLYYSSMHTLDNPWRVFFLTLWTESVENIVSIPAEKNKIEIPYFLSITTLSFFLSVHQISDISGSVFLAVLMSVFYCL